MTELDARQRAAVDAGPVDVFVAAGAGSGKTRVLAARFVSAVVGDGPYAPCDPRELLTVTFTEKAAGELSDRIRRELSAVGRADAARALGESWIMTIHGMCSRILHQHALEAGIDPYFRVLDDVEASALEAEAVEAATLAFLDSETGAVALFDAYGFEAIVAAAHDIRASIRALGGTAEGIRTLSGEESWRALEVSAGRLLADATEFEQLRKLKTVADNAEVTRAAAHGIALALSGEPGALARLPGSLGARRLKHLSSVDGLNELVDAATASIEAARSNAAQLLTSSFEQAFLAYVALIEVHCTRLKAKRGVLDFTDLEIKTLELLESRPAITATYTTRFAMLMLDEFQDTNALQMRIVSALSAGNLCTVGDENQSIYGFRHADVGVFRERAAAVTDRLQLDVNYRAAPSLLRALNDLFGQPELLGDRHMSLCAPDQQGDDDGYWGDRPRLEVRFIDWSQPEGAEPREVEASVVADRVAEFVAAGVEPGDIAVLMRALAGGRGEKVERALLMRGIPAYLVSGGTFFDRPEVLEARALLKVIDNVWDDAAMTIVLAGRLGGLSADALVLLRAHADRIAAERGNHPAGAHLWDALESEGLELSGADAQSLRRIARTIAQARTRRGLQALSDTVLEPLLDLDADLVLLASDEAGIRAWANLLKLARIAAEYESATGGDLHGFLAYLDLRELHATSEQAATLDGEAEAVSIMSIHAAKGLEFPVVVLVGLSGGRDVPGIALARIEGRPLLGMVLPLADGKVETVASAMVKSSLRNAADAEAVRLLYVGCTRAREALSVIARTRPDKEADDTLGDRVRSALGLGAAGAFECRNEPTDRMLPSVSLLAPPRPERAQTAQEGAAGGGSGTGELVRPVQRAVDSPVRPDVTPRVPPRVSYTGLSTYERCPHRYLLTSVVRLPAPPAAQGGEALVFGSAVHAALERIRSADDDVGAAIGSVAAAFGLDRSQASRLGDAVRTYLAAPTAAEVLAADRVMREAPIAVPIAGTILAGAIDVIAWHGANALIVDYKTGTAPLSPVEAEARYRLQGECYALAAFSAGADRVRVVFAELERDRMTSYTYTSAEGPAIESAVAAIIGRIACGEFAPRETYDRELCETCPGLGGMCPMVRPASGDAA